VWKTLRGHPAGRPARREIQAQLPKSLMGNGLPIRTGLGAIRATTAPSGYFPSLSAGISTGFSTASSEISDPGRKHWRIESNRVFEPGKCLHFEH
jgi:hypothetical protein